MNIILINPDTPTYRRLSNPIAPNQNVALPLGCLYLAATLTDFSHCILVGNNDEIITGIEDKVTGETMAFGISSMIGSMLGNALVIAEHIKERYPHIPIIWGGAIAKTLPEVALKNRLVDYLMVGECEESLNQLLRILKGGGDLDTVPGLGYKKDGELRFSPIEPMQIPLDRTFSIPYHLINMERHKRKLNIGGDRWFNVLSSRGCPYRCTFCLGSAASWQNNKMRYHTIEHITQEVSLLVNEYKADGIAFIDENLFVNERRLIELCKALKPFNIRFKGSGRANVLAKMKPATYEALRDAGFIGISFGVESGSQRILDYTNKKITLDEVYKTDQLMTEYGFFKSFNFMCYFPSETIDEFKETLQVMFNLASNPSTRISPYPFCTGNISKYTPLPGSQLYDTLVEDYGYTPPDTLEELVTYDNDAFGHRSWVSQEMVNYVEGAYQILKRLNRLFIGEGRDDQEIDEVLDELKGYIEQ